MNSEKAAREFVAQNYPSSVDTMGADRLVAAFMAGYAHALPAIRGDVKTRG